MIIAIDSKLPTWLEKNDVSYWHKVQSAQGSLRSANPAPNPHPIALTL